MTLSTHVLDTAAGLPAPGVPVDLERLDGSAWDTVASGRTDDDGRLADWVPAAAWTAGRYRLVFRIDGGFFPRVTVEFLVTDPTRHLHVPLLLSPYGYTTYRGS